MAIRIVWGIDISSPRHNTAFNDILDATQRSRDIDALKRLLTSVVPCVTNLNYSDRDHEPSSYEYANEGISETDRGTDPTQSRIYSIPPEAWKDLPPDPGTDQTSNVTALMLASVVVAVIIAFLLSKYGSRNL